MYPIETPTVLIADSINDYSNHLKDLLTQQNIHPIMAYRYEVALQKMKEYSFSLAIVDTDFDDGRGFELASFFRIYKKDLPILMTSENDSDFYLEKALQYSIGVILCKPYVEDHILHLIHLLGAPEADTQLSYFIKEPTWTYSTPIADSACIPIILDQVIESGKQGNFVFPNEIETQLILEELLVNAVYHAWGYQDEKEKHLPIHLKEDQKVLLEYAYNDRRFGFKVKDYSGTLTQKQLISHLYDLNRRDIRVREAIKKGEEIHADLYPLGGQGINLLRKFVSEYYIQLKPQQYTEFLVFYNKGFEKNDIRKSLSVLEL